MNSRIPQRAVLPLVAALVLMMAATGTARVEPVLTVGSVSPQPGEPGDTVKLHVTVKNSGDTGAVFEPVAVETVDGISVIGTTDAIGTNMTLCSGCRQVGTIYLKVSEAAVSGTYPVDVVLTRPNGYGIVETVEVQVDGSPKLVVSAPRIQAAPGTNVTTMVTVSNVGTDTASSTVLDMGADGVAMTPSPLDLGRIAAGGTVTRQVTLSVDSSRSNGIQTLDTTTTYRDEAEEKQTEGSLTLDILERAQVVVSDVTTDGATVGQEQTITITLENLGPGEAERIVADLGCGDTADVLSGRAFVGQLDDEENVPATFTVVPQATTVECGVTVRYSDASDQSVSETFTFAAAKQDTSPVLIGVAAIAVLLALGYWWRTRRQDELAEI